MEILESQGSYDPYPEEEKVDGYEVQRPMDEVVNIPGPATTPLVQLPFSNLEDGDVKGWYGTLPEEMPMVEGIHVENQIGDQDVPYEWQHWLHDENTIPPAQEDPNVQMPSGWVDPATGELVP